MLVEDHEINAQVGRLLLERAGMEVDRACDGAEAVEAAARHPYEIIFMDMQMPVMDGLTATARIRAAEPPGQRVPIIAMTANAFKEDEARCRAAGMDGYVTKPIKPQLLHETLLQHLGASALAEPQ